MTTAYSMSKYVSTLDLELLIFPPQLSSCCRGGGRGGAVDATSISNYVATKILIIEIINRRAWSGVTTYIVYMPASATVLLLLVKLKGELLELCWFHSFIPMCRCQMGGSPVPVKLLRRLLQVLRWRWRRGSAVPKLFILGGNGSGLPLVPFTWTVLHFQFLFWGPLWKMQVKKSSLMLCTDHLGKAGDVAIEQQVLNLTKLTSYINVLHEIKLVCTD